MKTPINDGILQTDQDFANFKALNADLSDYAGTGLDWNAGTKQFDATATGGGGGGSNPLITVNVKDAPYNATGDGVTDDTVAIQSAINAVASAGGGVVFLPKGIYLCNGAFDGTTNSILKIPYVQMLVDPCMSIELRGEVAPAITAGGTSPSSSMIKSTKTGTGTAPAILAAYTFNGRNLITDYTAAFSYVQVILRNLEFVTNPDPSIHGIRLDTATMAILEDVVVNAAQSSGVDIEPTHGTVGIWMPSTLNFATNYCNRVWVDGFDTGMVTSSEHFRGPQVNFINCHLACEFLSGGELCWANLMVYKCNAALKFTVLDPAFVNRSPVVLNMQLEYTSSGWQSRTLPDVLDSSNCGTGELRYFVWGPPGPAGIVIGGGANLRLIDLYTAGTMQYDIGTDARFVPVSGGVKLEVRNASTGVWVEATRYTNP